MSYETDTASNMNDLISKLSTFAVANGWTQDQYTAEAGATDGKLSLHRSTMYVHFAWASQRRNHIGVYQSLGFIAAGTDLWAHTDDSGNGPPATPTTGTGWSTSDRTISDIGIGPYTSYFFFEEDTYIHIALEYAPFQYRHFGFGILEKSWDWTGGEYCYGHAQRTGDPTLQPILLGSYGLSNPSHHHATIHAEDLDQEPVASKWGAFIPITALSASFEDRAGEKQVRFDGGSPGGMIGAHFNNLPSNSGDGFLPLSANCVFYRDVVSPQDNTYFMGFQPDVRTLNMGNFTPKQELTIGGDTWTVFPSVRKQNTGDLNESENLGIAYKKIV